MKKKELANPYIHMTIQDGILFATYRQGTQITLNIAKMIVNERIVFTEGKEYPQLIADHGLISIDKSARDYFSSKEGIKGVSAAAILVNSAFNTFIGNFFIQVSRPEIPARLFTEEKKALAWLKQYKSDS